MALFFLTFILQFCPLSSAAGRSLFSPIGFFFQFNQVGLCSLIVSQSGLVLGNILSFFSPDLFRTRSWSVNNSQCIENSTIRHTYQFHESITNILCNVIRLRGLLTFWWISIKRWLSSIYLNVPGSCIIFLLRHCSFCYDVIVTTRIAEVIIIFDSASEYVWTLIFENMTRYAAIRVILRLFYFWRLVRDFYSIIFNFSCLSN